MSADLRRRARLQRRLRVGVLAIVVVYFFLPYEVQSVIPVWLLFLAALGLEAEFFVSGWLQMRRGTEPRPVDRGPQPRDLADLGRIEYEDLPLFPPEWYRAPAPAMEARSYRRYALEALAGLALVAGILFYAVRPHGWDAVSAADKARAEARFSREASLIAGHPARVECDTSGKHVGLVQEADGVAEIGGREAFVTPSICNTLYQLAFKGRVRSFTGTARALAVLAHEAWHLHGVGDEGLTNCYGFQSGVELGVHLGLAESEARSMMREQLAEPPPSLPYRVPPGCRNGGEYDLHPQRSAFP
jgi:hypothetical protein